MTCESFSELCELYVLGLLDDEERRAANEHLQSGCQICSKAVDRALSLNAMISSNVPQSDPSPALRRRIAESLGGSVRKSGVYSPWATAAAAVLLLILGFLLDYSFRRWQSTGLEGQDAHLQEMIRILQASGTRIVHFGEATATAPHGVIFVNGQLGIVLVTDDLPKAERGWNYESWVVPIAGNPRAVAAFERPATGLVVSLLPGPIDRNSVRAVAVSLEPSNATLLKPTKVVFVAPF